MPCDLEAYLMMPAWPAVEPWWTREEVERAIAIHDLEMREWAKEYGMDYTVKDSGARKQFDSGMQRDTTEGKPRFDLIFDGPMMRRYAEHLRKGAVKYDARNWMKANSSAEMERFRESAARHFAQWIAGDTDEDHAAAVIFNLNGFEYVKEQLNGRGTPVQSQA